jgi:hypothetical protein
VVISATASLAAAPVSGSAPLAIQSIRFWMQPSRGDRGCAAIATALPLTE